MRFMYSSLVAAAAICLGFTVGCGHDSAPPETQENIRQGQAIGETHMHIMKPGFDKQWDEAKAGNTKRVKKK